MWRHISALRLAMAAMGAIGALATALAATAVVLVLTEPMAVATAIDRGDLAFVLRAAAGLVTDAVRGILML